MAKIVLETPIKNSAKVCYRLCLNVDLHQLTTAKTGEHIVDGVKSGVMKLGDFVTWKAKHFGVWQTLTTKIIEAIPFTYFVDEMQNGAFQSMRHEHYYTEKEAGTLMKDVFYFESPFGILGKIFNYFVLEKYMAKLLVERNQLIKEIAESDKWKAFVF